MSAAGKAGQYPISCDGQILTFNDHSLPMNRVKSFWVQPATSRGILVQVRSRTHHGNWNTADFDFLPGSMEMTTKLVDVLFNNTKIVINMTYRKILPSIDISM